MKNDLSYAVKLIRKADRILIKVRSKFFMFFDRIFLLFFQLTENKNH